MASSRNITVSRSLRCARVCRTETLANWLALLALVALGIV
jgi:hypothetical protein